MRGRTKVVAAVAGAASLVAVVAAVGNLLWDRAIERDVRELSVPSRRSLATSSLELLHELPSPVRRYLRFALAPGQRSITRARIRQRGVMRALDRRARWNPFTAIERFTSNPVGFVWSASMRVAPLVRVRIRDAYLEGRGVSEASVAGVIRFRASKQEAVSIADAALLRFLAEAPWIPTALLPSDVLSWSPLDERNARVTLRDGTRSVAVDVAFGERGEIERVSADRYASRALGVLPWSGRFSDYESMTGMMIPTAAEVEWVTSEGPVPVWRGRVVSAEYELT